MISAFINTRHGTLVLDGREWKSEDPLLTQLANMIAPPDSVGPEHGDYQREMLNRIRLRLGGVVVIRGGTEKDVDIVH